MVLMTHTYNVIEYSINGTQYVEVSSAAFAFAKMCVEKQQILMPTIPLAIRLAYLRLLIKASGANLKFVSILILILV